jgi:hypothetical protein
MMYFWLYCLIIIGAEDFPEPHGFTFASDGGNFSSKEHVSPNLLLGHFN